jgi:methylglutaconyl-CoA hydratase
VYEQIGLVSEVYSSEEELDRAITSIAAQLTRAGPNAIRLTKQLIDHVTQLPSVEATRDYTTRAIAAARISPEGQDGLGSFFNKKPPSWMPAKPAKSS